VVAAAEKCVVAYNGTDFVRVGSTSVFGAPSTAMTIDTSGNVGLGVTPNAWNTGNSAMQLGAVASLNGTPTATQLSNNFYQSASGSRYITTAAASIYSQSSGAHSWSIAPSGTAGNAITFTQAMTLDASGNLGIGITPSAKLDVQGGSSATIARFIGGESQYTIRLLNTANTGGGSINANTGAGSGISLSSDSGPMIFYAASSERMRLDTNGWLYINRTTPITGNASVLNISHSGVSYYGIMLQNISASSSNALVFINSSNNATGAISVDSTTTTYATSSDYRLKENIQPMQNALAKVAALKPVTYNWKTDGTDGEGFIAHELAEVCPNAVTGEKDAVNKDGSIKSQGIDTSFLVATLTAALQEAHSLIKDLQTRVAQLEAK
jgi:hypothetical protein